MSSSTEQQQQQHAPIEEDAPISVPDSGDSGEGGKIKMIVQLVKKCLGVKDIASMRLSLPASLLEPIPNLEYWHYLDRPDIFASINDSYDPFERMLAVIRFAFTKDLKFVHGKVCKPYNSVLGEHFRAHWDVVSNEAPQQQDTASVKSGASSFKSIDSANTAGSASSSSSAKPIKAPSTAPTSPEPPSSVAQPNSSSSSSSEDAAPRIRVVFVTEQVSHHPPVSAYYASCPMRHIEMQGIDQISAKVSGTTLRVAPGPYNQGIYVRLTGGPGAGEAYHITHPVASVNGILRGSFYVTVGDSTIITCTSTAGFPKFRAIIEYKEESWLGRAHFLVEGVVHVVHEGESDHEQWTKVKHVPHNRVAAVFEGSWRGQVRWKRVGALSYPHTTSSSASSPSPSHVQLPAPTLPSASVSKADFMSGNQDEWQLLIDLNALQVIPKEVRPLEKQAPHESRKLWKDVTEKLQRKEYSEATREKVAIEQKQREDAAERKRQGVEFVPRYFEKGLDNGYVDLTEEGRKAVEEELAEESSYCVEGLEQGIQLSA